MPEHDWKARYEEEYRTVDRVWRALGISRFEQARGKAIFEIVADQRKALERIATGDGYYGAQARQYKNIARKALGLKEI